MYSFGWACWKPKLLLQTSFLKVWSKSQPMEPQTQPMPDVLGPDLGLHSPHEILKYEMVDPWSSTTRIHFKFVKGPMVQWSKLSTDCPMIQATQYFGWLGFEWQMVGALFYSQIYFLASNNRFDKKNFNIPGTKGWRRSLVYLLPCQPVCKV